MRILPFTASLVAVAAVATGAWAHARLVSSGPAASGVVRTAPAEVRLRFNEPVLPRFVTVAVTGPDSRALHVDTPAIDRRDRRQVTARVHGGGAPGVYRVSWSAATADMHRMTGSYTFTVRP